MYSFLILQLVVEYIDWACEWIPVLYIRLDVCVEHDVGWGPLEVILHVGAVID